MKHTQGKVDWSHRPIPNDENEMYATQVYTTKDGQTICTLHWYPTERENEIINDETVFVTRTHREANAELIAEAFNVTNESGLTPRQLLEQRNGLLNALEIASLYVSSLSDKSDWNIIQQAINNAQKK